MKRDWFMQWAAVRMMYSLRIVPPQNPMSLSFMRRACDDQMGPKTADHRLSDLNVDGFLGSTTMESLIVTDQPTLYLAFPLRTCHNSKTGGYLEGLQSVSTCHGHSPGGQSSPLTMRVILAISEFIVSSKTTYFGTIWFSVTIPRGEGSDFCSVELVLGSVSFNPVEFPTVVFCRTYLNTVRVSLPTMAPHLKVSARKGLFCKKTDH